MEESVTPERRWYIARRWQQYEGEVRANQFRILGIGLFYVNELVNYYGLDLGFVQFPKVASVTPPFHAAITALSVVWVLTAWLVQTTLARRIFPESLKYLATAADLILATAILSVCDGPRSPLLIAYFLLINLAALRLDAGLVTFATAGAIVGYVSLLGVAAWYKPELKVPRYYEVITLLGIVLAGLFATDTVRRARDLAEDFAREEA